MRKRRCGKRVDIVRGMDDGSSDDDVMGGILIYYCFSFRPSQQQPSTAPLAQGHQPHREL